MGGVCPKSNPLSTFQVYLADKVSLLELFILLDFTISHGMLLFHRISTYKKKFLGSFILNGPFYAFIRKLGEKIRKIL